MILWNCKDVPPLQWSISDLKDFRLAITRYQMNAKIRAKMWTEYSSCCVIWENLC